MKKVLLLSLYLLMFVPLLTNGQATNASFTGLVTNEKNEPIPGATVQIKNESTGFTTGTQTQADGRYFLRQLPLGGPYVLTISSIGFATTQRNGFSLDQGSSVSVNVAIQEQATALDEIVVTGNAFADNVNSFGSVTQISAA